MKTPALLSLALVSALCLTLAAPSHAALNNSLVVTPESPTNQVPISLRVSGWHSDGCWDLDVPHTCSRIGNQITITFQSTDHWTPGTMCATVIQDFAGSCELGILPAGTYTVDVFENQSTLRLGLPIARQFSFEVTAAVAVEGRQWSSLKALFRSR